MTKSFTWLHLSDLHAGLKEQSWMWPQVKEAILSDLPTLLKRTGALDAVIFTGDLTQTGSKEEFQLVTGILQELWSVFRQNDCDPILIAIPGNHDLVRPDINLPAARVLSRIPLDEAVFSELITDPNSPYRKMIGAAFANYDEWYASVPDVGIKTTTNTPGLFVGDYSAELENGVGIVGINSSWLQLFGGSYEGKLHLDPRQLLPSVGSDPKAWVDRHWVNLVLTHHPPSWSSPKARDHWNAGIAPAGRFDLHLFGHMHEPDFTATAMGGSPFKNQFQAPSLFGLEKYEGGYTRQHGYAAGQATQASDHPEIRIWPRKLQRVSSGKERIVPTSELDLGDDAQSFVVGVGRETIVAPSPQLNAITLSDRASVPGAVVPFLPARAIEKLRFYLPAAPAAQNVRRVEQRFALDAIREKRAVWIGAEWGAGEYGFVAALQKSETQPIKTYRVPLERFTDRESFFSHLKQSTDLSFEQFCSELATASPAYLLLEDFPFSNASLDDQRATVADLEDVISTALQYAQDLRILIIARREPAGHAFSFVGLKPLDEDDVLTYVEESGKTEFTTPQAIQSIFRHTDGVPARIDSALRELEVITIDQLGSTDRDLRMLERNLTESPKALQQAVTELASSAEPIRQRAYLLLKALSCFPQGETIDRLKRFFEHRSLQYSHALELLESSLITAVSRTDVTGTSETARLLSVPKPVRDFVRGHLKPREWRDLSQRAAALYFGEKWNEGAIRPIALSHFKNPKTTGAELANATTIIVRLLVSAAEESNERGLSAAIGLATNLARALSAGSHYRAVVNLYRDVFTHVPKSHIAKFEQMQVDYSSCLRMLGEHDAAKEVALTLISSSTNTVKQDAYNSLSLVEKALGNFEEAVKAATAAWKINKGSALGEQARSTMVELQPDFPNRAAELKRLEEKARNKGRATIANNLALRRADDDSTSATEVDEAIAKVLASAIKDRDYYNGVRALVRRARAFKRRGERLPEVDLRMLIAAYHYVFNERMPVLFDSVHNALWSEFERGGDTGNLYRLFRQSSLVWRLRGDAARETTYVGRLAHTAQSIIFEGRSPDRDAAYYLVRYASTMPNAVVIATPGGEAASLQEVGRRGSAKNDE